jgi:WD40 repeat protein
MYLWNVDGSELHRWEVQSRIQDMGILPDGKRMVVVNSDRNLKVFDVFSRRELFTLPESDAVTSLHVSQLREEVLVNIAQQVSSSQHAPSVRLWDIAARRVTQRYLGHFQSRFIVRSCFGGPREEFVVSGSEDAQVYIWHRHYGSLLEVLAGHSASITSVCWLNSCSYGCSPTTWLVSASDDHTLRVWSSSMSIEEHRVEAVDADTEVDDMNGPAEPEIEAVPEPLGLEDITESPNVLRRRTSHGVDHASDTTHADEEVLG